MPCAICHLTTKCFKCQINDLQRIIEIQNYELEYLRKDSNAQLILKDDYTQHFEIDNKFLPIKYYGEMIDYAFLTITFDPNKFGIFNQRVDEQNYIFRTLHKSIKKEYIKQLTGCFEYQKNGTTHAHIIIKTEYNDSKIEDFFRPFYTDDPKNKYAIKCYRLQKEKCETYLQKESTEFFRYDLSFEDMDEPSPFIVDKIQLPTTLNDLINALVMFHNSSKHELKLLAKRLMKKYQIEVPLDDIIEQVHKKDL